MPVGEEGEPGQQAHAQPGCDECLYGDVVVRLELDGRGEAGPSAGLDEMLTAAFAAGYPAGVGVGGEIRPGAVPGAVGRCDDVQRLFEERCHGGVAAIALGRFAVLEDQRHVDVVVAQGAECVRRFGFDQGELDAGVLGGDAGGGKRHQGGQCRGEGGEADPAGAQPGQLVEFGVHGFDLREDRLGAVHQQPAGLGEPDAAPHPLQQRYADLGLQFGELMAHRRLGVVQRLGGRRDRTFAGDGHQYTQPTQVDHG